MEQLYNLFLTFLVLPKLNWWLKLRRLSTRNSCYCYFPINNSVVIFDISFLCYSFSSLPTSKSNYLSKGSHLGMLIVTLQIIMWNILLSVIVMNQSRYFKIFPFEQILGLWLKLEKDVGGCGRYMRHFFFNDNAYILQPWQHKESQWHILYGTRKVLCAWQSCMVLHTATQ